MWKRRERVVPLLVNVIKSRLFYKIRSVISGVGDFKK